MDTFPLTPQIKEKSIAPRVYFGTLVYKTLSRIWCVAGYDLENASTVAKIQFSHELQDRFGQIAEPGSIKLDKYDSVEISKLLAQFLNESKPITESSLKNELMKKVISSNDLDLFEKTKFLFEDVEIQLVKERIHGQKNK